MVEVVGKSADGNWLNIQEVGGWNPAGSRPHMRSW